jgi:hypothetical protein
LRSVDLTLGQHIETLAALTQQRGAEQTLLLTEQLSNARTCLDLTERWLVVRVEIGRLTQLAARTDVDSLRALRAALLAQQTSASDEISRIGVELRRLDERTSAIAKAVAAIAAHLTENDTHCPVCDTEFVAGELLRVAQVRPGGRSTSAFELADRLAASEALSHDFPQRSNIVDVTAETSADRTDHRRRTASRVVGGLLESY